VRALQEEGVDIVFGHPGGVVLDIYDAIYRAGLRHVLVRHEQGGVHMADGYARATGRTGVALVTSGPGVTNAITGLATAYMDSIPLVLFTGQVSTPMIGNDAFQEADNMGLTRPVTKHNWLVKDVRDLAATIKEAFHIASTGRPGPVVVDLPKDVSQAQSEFHYPKELQLEHYQPRYEGHWGQIKKAMALILKARRPAVYYGGGVLLSKAHRELLEFCERLGAPVTYTLMGIGGIPGNHRLSLGMLGMHGTYRANMAVDHADVLIAIGARFDDRVTGKLEEFSPRSKKIHIDIDPTSIRKSVYVDIPIVGDVKNCLQKFLKLMEEERRLESYPEQIARWWSDIEEWEREHPLTYAQPADGAILPQYVIDKVYQLTGGEAVVSTDVGQHQMWAAQYYHCQHPHNWVTSGGLGTMGFGLPSAIGAQFGRPKDTVVCITSEGSLLMTAQELAVAVEHELPIKIVNLNNAYLGMVRQWQEFFYQRRYSEIDLASGPDWVRYAEAFGAVGLRATRPEEVEPTLEKGLATNRPVLMDFQCSREENCFPMVPAGAPSSKMIHEPPIDSLCVAETLDPKVSQITLVTHGNDETIEQIVKQLYKLIDIIKVVDYTEGSYVGRELALLKVRTLPESRAEVMRIAEIFRAKIVDVTPDSYTIEVTGSSEKIRAVAQLLEPLGLVDVVRTGRVATPRGL
jgi:acetolactate synthase-1/2/3 large subunit